jgi:hypothetical protein
MKAAGKVGVLAGIWVGLALLVSPAAAEPVTLSCRADDGPATWTFRIDYVTEIIEELGDTGSALISTKAGISANVIAWALAKPVSQMTFGGERRQTTAHWEGHIDRLSGIGWMRQYNDADVAGTTPGTTNFTCRQATQKF